MSICFFEEIISWQGESADQRKAHALTDIPSPKTNKELQSFLDILNYLRKFSPSDCRGVEPLQKLISVKTDYAWNRKCKDIYDKAKAVVTRDACMKFCNTA